MRIVTGAGAGSLAGLLVIVLVAEGSRSRSAEERWKRPDKSGRFLFSIVSFKNDPCTADAKNGTCYTVSECETRNGVNGGSCAQGYGVCCQFSANCGATFSENCTYFESNSPTAGSCTASMCKANSNICQMRLDFNSFDITGPSTSSTVVGTLNDGNLNPGAGMPVSTRSQCLTDTFSVSSPGVTNPPIICGNNNGQHMYVDVCEDCVDLAFQLGQTGVDATISQRTWNIKVTQYSCDSENLAPRGCTQYFYGSNSQVVKTFNYDGGQHLANQNQQICVRNERGNCRICWVQVARGDFDVSSTKMTGVDMSTGKVKKCCSYGTSGSATEGYDCLVIPGAKKTAATTGKTASQICGNLIVTVSGDVFPATSICSTRCPFSIQFASDNYEFAMNMDATDEAGRDNAGFMLTYIQDGMGCN